MTIASSSKPVPRQSDHEYDDALNTLQTKFKRSAPPFFTTDVDPEKMWKAYLDGFADDERQYHNCNACKRFIQTYGGIVNIDDDGGTRPVLWPIVAGVYEEPFTNLRKLVAKAIVTGVFLHRTDFMGMPQTGPWTHLAVNVPKAMRFEHPLKTAGQAMAEKLEEFDMLSRGMREVQKVTVSSARKLLEDDDFYRADKVLGPVRWLDELHKRKDAAKTARQRVNLMWLAVATAPPGFCHVKTTMAATLYEDLKEGLTLGEVKRRFAQKMNPLQYQRPTAAPSAGNVAVAEKLFAKMQAAGSLRRCFATFSDLHYEWTEALGGHRAQTPGPIFGGVPTKPKAAHITQLVGATTMTWVKFEREVLPHVSRISWTAPVRAAYIALTTAVDFRTPPILQWDDAERRYPVAWYVYPGGSASSAWGLLAGSKVRVRAITFLPPMYAAKNHDHQGKGVIFVLEDCRDLQRSGLGLFPEFLKSEYRDAARTIEAYSRTTQLEPHPHYKAGGAVAGLDLRKGATWNHTFEVEMKDGHKRSITLDRWD